MHSKGWIDRADLATAARTRVVRQGYTVSCHRPALVSKVAVLVSKHSLRHGFENRDHDFENPAGTVSKVVSGMVSKMTVLVSKTGAGF